jgi:hypothetical protein
MKYVFSFCGTGADQAAFDAMTPEELGARYAEVGRWFAEHRERLGHGNQLQGPETGTTVSFQAGGSPIVKDGLFLVQGSAGGHRCELFRWALRHSMARPGLEGCDQRVLHALLGQVEVTEAADQSRRHVPCLLAKDVCSRREQARAAQARALDLTQNSAERALLERCLFSSRDMTMPTPAARPE